MGIFSLVGGLFSGGAQKKASQKATDAILSSLNQGIAAQTAFQDQTRADYLPYTRAGMEAIGRLGDFAGLNGGDAQGAAYAGLQANPVYQSLFTKGQDTILANASATGGLRGGNTQGALAELAPDVLSRVYSSVNSELGGLASLGLGAQNTVTGVGQGVTNNVTGLYEQQGKVRAANYVTRGGINAANWANAGKFLDDIGPSIFGSIAPGGLGGLGSIFGLPTAGTTAKLNPAAQSLIAGRGSIF